MHTYFLPLLAAALLTGCARETLNLHSEYTTYHNLASYIVNTPDPELDNPTVGQKLILTWDIPSKLQCYSDLTIELTIRFRNSTEITLFMPVEKWIGYYVYELLNQDFFDTDGIVTFKADLFSGNTILSSWRHQLWVDYIRIQHETNP